MTYVSRRAILRGAGAAGGLTGCATWRRHPPADAGTIALALPRYDHRLTPDGTDVWLAARPGTSLTSLSVVLDAGFNRDPEDRQSRAWALAQLLREGTRTRDRNGLQLAFGELGGRFGTHAGGRALILYANVLASGFEQALGLLAHVVGDAALPEARLDDLRRQFQAPRRVSPQRLAAAACVDILVGSRTGTRLAPFGHTLETLTTAELRATWIEASTRKPRAVVAAGGIEPESAYRAIESLAAELPSGSAPPIPPLPATEPRLSPGIVVIDRPGRGTLLSYGRLGPTEMDPAHDAYDLASTFLDSRVYDQLRERQRNAYGLEASKLLTPAGVLTLQSTRVEPTHAGDALKGLIEALNTATDGALHQRYAANTRARGLVAEMDKLQRTKSLARTAIELHTHGLPADYFQRRVRAVNRFSMSQMTHAFRTYFRRKKIQIVLVGRADRLAPIAERVQSGAVTVADGAALARSLNR